MCGTDSPSRIPAPRDEETFTGGEEEGVVVVGVMLSLFLLGGVLFCSWWSWVEDWLQDRQAPIGRTKPLGKIKI